VAAAREMRAAAVDAGVNFFDNAEAYAAGKSEVVMGEAIKALKWPRLNYIVSTKFFWGLEREGLTVKTTEAGDSAQTLFFVDSIGSYDDRMQKVSQATARILDRAQVDFMILGKE